MSFLAARSIQTASGLWAVEHELRDPRGAHHFVDVTEMVPTPDEALFRLSVHCSVMRWRTARWEGMHAPVDQR